MEKRKKSNKNSQKNKSLKENKQSHEEETKKKIMEVANLIKMLKNYPYPIDEKKKEEIKEKLLKTYKKENDKIKGAILFGIIIELSSNNNIKNFFSQKTENNHPLLISLDYYNSFSGQKFLLKMLGDIDDNYSIRILSHFLSKYLAQQNQFYNALADYCIELLGDSKNPFSLEVLLDFAESFPNRFSINNALEKWMGKAKSLKVGKEKVKRLEKLIRTEKKGSESYYY